MELSLKQMMELNNARAPALRAVKAYQATLVNLWVEHRHSGAATRSEADRFLTELLEKADEAEGKLLSVGSTEPVREWVGGAGWALREPENGLRFGARRYYTPEEIAAVVPDDASIESTFRRLDV